MGWNPFKFQVPRVEIVEAPPAESKPPTYTIDDLPDARPTALAATRSMWWDGEKFPGGFGATDLLSLDYWTLRKRSGQLFRQNLYARGVIRRLITNEINTGLHLEATPSEAILGLEDDALADWSENVENRFELWGADPRSCDHKGAASFGSLQATVRAESLIDGDLLAVLLQDRRTKMPRLHLVSGSVVRQPLEAALTGKLRNGNRVVHGVELDADGRHLAFWITVDGKEQRLQSMGRDGRRVAWLIYGTDRRLDDVRGEPLLAIMLQSLREIDRFRDSTQRAAAVQSMIALAIEKTEDKPGSRPLAGGAVRRGTETIVDQAGQERTTPFADLLPGIAIDELQHGEKIHGFAPTVAGQKFGEFEASIVYTIAWGLEIPPEILTLTFQNNYSASQAATNEFKIYLNRVRTLFAEQLCQPVYVEWLLSAVLAQRVQAPGLLEAWRDPMRRDEFWAWCFADWSGHIKPSIDAVKIVTAEEKKLSLGLTTFDRAAREISGTKFSQNVKKLAREAKALAEAVEPLKALDKPAAPEPPGKNDNPDQVDEADERDSARKALRVLAARD